MDLLSEYGTSELNSQEKNSPRSVSHPLADYKMDFDMPMAEQLNPEAPSTAQPSSDLPAAEQNEPSMQGTDQINILPQVRDQMDVDLEKKTETDQLNPSHHQSPPPPPTTSEMNLNLPASENPNPAPASVAKEKGS